MSEEQNTKGEEKALDNIISLVANSFDKAEDKEIQEDVDKVINLRNRIF